MTQTPDNDYIQKNHKYKVIVIGVSTGGSRAAIAAVNPDYVLPLEKIGHVLRKLESER